MRIITNGVRMSFEESVDRWFDFVEEYNRQSSVPLSYVLLPNPSTTGLACKNLGRKFIGIEIDKNYYKIAKERIENEQNSKKSK